MAVVESLTFLRRNPVNLHFHIAGNLLWISRLFANYCNLHFHIAGNLHQTVEGSQDFFSGVHVSFFGFLLPIIRRDDSENDYAGSGLENTMATMGDVCLMIHDWIYTE